MGLFDDALEKAEQETVHRPIPHTTYGRVQHLLKQARIADRRQIRATGGKPASKAELARRVAQVIGVSQRTVERYRDKQIKHAAGDHAAKLAAAVRKTWQPRVKDQARKKAATTAGITVETRARFGFTAAPGTTDDGRIRLITQHLPPEYAARLFAAQDSGAPHDQMKDIVAEGLQEIYFKDKGRRADGLLVEFNAIEYVEIDYS
ncbi:XRE family transcriptional regulator [Streptomyces sp. H10-C2]|uniref:telomere-protecting terminal protein Tpg n=1 Tax=unclassified Streptomyces TaxID=2593676 RepID=UPI0024B905B6|nr:MULTISPECIES: XRE family transcriptional regulator [unclassified Streptomyces]MDJ0345864.1 XRE family transcriptional regulator [Streptomyces sp. PH10-H1]MDJ0371170.1 XRE family transcriptional regulator [Streptomyces sp. H10-C2]